MTEEVADQERLQPSQATGWRSGFGGRTLTVLFLAEVLVLALAQLPMNLSWGAFAFMDQGANLSVQTLLNRGLVPTVDFGYPYGLLPLLIGRLWFGLLGLTPSAYAAAMLVCDLLIAWGLARCLTATKAGPAGIALVIVAMPWAVLSSYINLTHALEAILICHALAEHALGRRQQALALLTTCLFVKPTMGYVYGLLLTLLIIRDAWAGGVRGFLRNLAPAIATGVVLVALCGCWFGINPLINSLFPLTGATNYRSMNYGFFRGVGRRFWLPDDVWPTFYLVTPAGHYLIGTVVLSAAAVAALLRLALSPSQTRANVDEVVACCGIMQLTFLSTFYADFMSWTYYYYILIIGLAAFAARGGRSAVVVLVIAAAALVGNKYPFSWVKQHWKTTRPNADMAGLWTSKDVREEWHRILGIIGDRQASVLSTNGDGLTAIMPGFLPSETMFILPGIPLATELKRKLDQVASAEFVVLRKSTHQLLDMFPEFREVLDGCELVSSSDRYLIYRRLRPPKIPSTAPGETKSPSTGDNSQPNSRFPFGLAQDRVPAGIITCLGPRNHGGADLAQRHDTRSWDPIDNLRSHAFAGLEPMELDMTRDPNSIARCVS